MRSLRPARLSRREVEVLRLLAQGLRYAEIAEVLVISENTVEKHAQRLYAKLGARNRQEAVLLGAHLLAPPIPAPRPGGEVFTPDARLQHDLANALTLVVGYSELLQMDPTLSPAQRQLVALLAKGTRLSVDVLERVRAYSTRSPRVTFPRSDRLGVHGGSDTRRY